MSPAVLTAVPRTLRQWGVALEARLAHVADGQARVRELTDDSRTAGPGDLFFARPGARGHGRAYAREAVARGARAVVTEVDLDADLPALRVPDVSRALRRAADLRYGFPQEALDLVAVTGTKGKTTTAHLVAAALRHAGRPPAVLGTVSYDVGDGAPRPALTTTPGVLAIRRLLAAARDAGCRTAVLEVSSHALDQGRVEGLSFRAAVFTNLGRDHLDYHGSLEAYLEAKGRLFAGLPATATAVLNVEDPAWRHLAALGPARVLAYGRGATAELRAEDVRLDLERTRFRLVAPGQRALPVVSPLVGAHNVLNLLGAIGAAAAAGVDLREAAEGVSTLSQVRGRLERVEGPTDLVAFVDYAHTEESLREVLAFLREVGASPLVCVVGCGGDRDRAKRPRMARTAAALSDRAVLTSDNPRNEAPEAILREMVEGLDPDLAARTTTIQDRREAIRHAVDSAPPGACVVVAGKGHETYQIVGERRLPFDDVAEVRRALARRAGRAEDPRSRTGAE